MYRIVGLGSMEEKCELTGLKATGYVVRKECRGDVIPAHLAAFTKGSFGEWVDLKPEFKEE